MYTPPSNRYRSWIPYGFDFELPEVTKCRLQLERGIRALLLAEGFQEVNPPIFDFQPTFQFITRHAKDNPLFQVRSRGGEELAVRSELTVQVIKAVANGYLAGSDSKEQLRFSYIQPVFQDHLWGSGHKRQYMQAGVELLGGDSLSSARELLKLAWRCIALEGLEPQVLYGDVRFIEVLFGMMPPRARSELSLAFHNKDTAALHAICASAEIEEPLTRLITAVPLCFGGPQILKELLILCRPFSQFQPLLEEADKYNGVIYDFSLVRELSYYTGPVFEAYIPGSSEKIFTGGIYDSLYSEFSANNQKNACGFALNLSLLAEHHWEETFRQSDAKRRSDYRGDLAVEAE